MAKSRKHSHEQIALALPIDDEPAEALEERIERAEQVAHRWAQYEEQQRQAEAEELARQQQRRAKKYGVVFEALQLARRHDDAMTRALRMYAEARGGKDIKISKWWLHKTTHPNVDELVNLFKIDEQDALHFEDDYWQVLAELFEQTHYTVYTRDEQGFITGSQMRVSEHRGVYSLATIGLCANLGADWESTLADKIDWQWRVIFGRIGDIGDEEFGLIAKLKGTGIKIKTEISQLE